MRHQTDKEHEEEEACSTSEVQHTEKRVILRLKSTGGWRRVTNVDNRVDREGCTVMRLHS